MRKLAAGGDAFDVDEEAGCSPSGEQPASAETAKTNQVKSTSAILGGRPAAKGLIRQLEGQLLNRVAQVETALLLANPQPRHFG